jgi:hypothetical protein
MVPLQKKAATIKKQPAEPRHARNLIRQLSSFDLIPPNWTVYKTIRRGALAEPPQAPLHVSKGVLK